ncbi:hypothetical protein ACHHRT_13755 [Desulfurivibrio sp. D14AmB]|uniref:hypothetical protein n=1 Tax=Desulfurivibrio sp. D14AmB TaxID=3374370 RepID=UPI00376EB1F2
MKPTVTFGVSSPAMAAFGEAVNLNDTADPAGGVFAWGIVTDHGAHGVSGHRVP